MAITRTVLGLLADFGALVALTIRPRRSVEAETWFCAANLRSSRSVW
jgi:hypothetical protein